VVLIRPVE